MNISLTVYGVDGTEACQLEETISALPDVQSVHTRYRPMDANEHVIGELYASAAIPIAKLIIKFVALGVASEAVKDGYRAGRERLKARIEEWQAEKNEDREPRSRINFTLLEEDEPIVRLITREDRD